MIGLTDRQRQILAFVERNIRRKGYPPTHRDIMAELGLKSTNGIAEHLDRIERKGYLRRGGFAHSRGIVLLDHSAEHTNASRVIARASSGFAERAFLSIMLVSNS